MDRSRPRYVSDGMLRTLALVLVLAGCNAAAPLAPSEPNAPTRAPRPSSPEPIAPSRSTTAGSDACEAELRTVVSTRAGGAYEVLATLTNVSDRTLEPRWDAACPGPGAEFTGLPDGYDEGSSCAAGACPSGPRETRRRSLAPGATLVVASFVLTPEGDACNRALPLGRYDIGASLPLEGIRVCDAGHAEVVVDTPPPSEPAIPPTRRTAPPAPARPDPHERERCPAMGCAYTPCPPGVEPPTGCAAVCGCTGMRFSPLTAPVP